MHRKQFYLVKKHRAINFDRNMESITNINWKKALLLAFFIIGIKFSISAQGVPGVYVYPENNQSQDQQAQDENDCYSSASNDVGQNPSYQPDQGQHKTLKRTGVGAGAGAIIGGGKGAAIGAGVGAISGRRSKKRDAAEENAAISNDLTRAYASCLKSKGYSVE
jgi:hypothetical protein